MTNLDLAARPGKISDFIEASPPDSAWVTVVTRPNVGHYIVLIQPKCGFLKSRGFQTQSQTSRRIFPPESVDWLDARVPANVWGALAAKRWGENMATFPLIEYQDASPEVRAIYDDIMTTRKTDWINNFWKALAHDPATLRRTWESIKQIMAPGALDPLTKELLYVAVSVTNNCQYCIASHTASARKKGMTDAMFHELQAVIGMANETNKLVTGYQVEVDEQFKSPLAD
jgi:AhpD family alkylhydroperoxidase